MKFLIWLYLNLLILVPLKKTMAEDFNVRLELFGGGNISAVVEHMVSPPNRAPCPDMQRFDRPDLCPRFLSKTAADEDKTICICQTGDEPKKHIGWFKRGCANWLERQYCQKKVTLEHHESLDPVLSKRASSVENVSYAYIGHWKDGTVGSINHMEEIFEPMLKKYNLNFEIDNTACRGASNPYKLRKYFRRLKKKLPPNQLGRMVYSANQAISVGEWDEYLPGESNIPTRVCDKIEFPKCRGFANSGCTGTFQKDEIVICIGEDNSEQFLKCQRRGFLFSWQQLNSKRNSYELKYLPPKGPNKKGYYELNFSREPLTSRFFRTKKEAEWYIKNYRPSENYLGEDLRSFSMSIYEKRQGYYPLGKSIGMSVGEESFPEYE